MLHAVQLMALSGEKWPALHKAALVGSEHSLPAGHLTHDVSPSDA